MATTKRKFVDVNKIKLLYGQILVEPVVVDDVGVQVKKGNKKIFLAKPQSYDDKTSFGKIINTAQQRMTDRGDLIDMFVKPGDDIVFQPYSANKVRLEGKDYLIIHEEDIYFIVL